MSESPGVLIGISNIATRARSRSAAGPDPDATPTLYDRLRMTAWRALEGRDAFIEDAIIHGRRVRLYTNSHHLSDFWRDNWFSAGEWLERTGLSAEREPALTVYAVINVSDQPEARYLSSRRHEAFLFNTSYYGDLRASCMEALAGRLAPERARLFHGGAVEVNRRGLLFLYPVEILHPTPTWGLMEFPGARFLADGWVAADEAGRLHRVEKKVYVRTSVLQSYPEVAAALLGAKFENVPAPQPGQDPAERLAASPDARAMADPGALFGRSRVARGPVETAAVFTLRAGKGTLVGPATVEPFRVPSFELNVGSVEGHPREVARLIARTAGI